MFDTFTSRFELDGYLTLRTAMRIGAGRAIEPGASDLPVVKDGLGQPYIPGSSVKGVLRAYCESLLRAMAGGQADLARKLACNPLSEAKKTDEVSFRRCIAPDELLAFKAAAKQKTERGEKGKSLDEILIDHTCLACQVFGAQWLSSRLQIMDCLIEEVKELRHREFRYERRNGVAIDRDTETAGDSLLYDFEVVPAGIRFKFHLLMENATPAQLGLICLGLRAFEEERRSLGGATSRGLGSVKLSWKTAHHFDTANIEAITPQERLNKLFDLLLPENNHTPGTPVEAGDATVKGWVQALRDEVGKKVLA